MRVDEGRRPITEADWGVRAGGFAIAAFTVPATASAMAVLVYRGFDLASLTRYWINLDLGWAVMFIAMGVMAFMM
jgi:hypothetical protein